MTLAESPHLLALTPEAQVALLLSDSNIRRVGSYVDAGVLELEPVQAMELLGFMLAMPVVLSGADSDGAIALCGHVAAFVARVAPSGGEA